MNIATSIPPKYRKAIYIALAVAVPVLTAWNPSWGSAAVAIAGFFGFAVATANVDTKVGF